VRTYAITSSISLGESAPHATMSGLPPKAAAPFVMTSFRSASVPTLPSLSASNLNAPTEKSRGAGFSA
jgi:hypothetical protein